MKLGPKIVLVFAIVILIGATIIYAGVGIYGQKTLETSISEASKTFGDGILYRLERALYEKLLDIEWFANSHTPQHFLTELKTQGKSLAHPLNTVNEDLLSFSENSNFWDEVSLSDTTGTIKASSNIKLIDSKIEDDDWDGFSKALSGETYISDVYTSEDFGLTIEFMVPVKMYRENSEIVGVMIAHLQWEQMKSIIEEFEKDAIFHKFLLVDKFGKTIHSTGEESSLK